MTTVTRTLYATPSSLPALGAVCDAMAFVRADLWRRFGALRNVGKSAADIRKEVTAAGWYAGLAVDGTIRAETTKDAVNDILTYKAAACAKVRQAVAKRTSDATERKRLYTLLKSDQWLEDSYLHRMMRKHFRHGVSASGNRQKEFGRDSAHLVVDVGYFTTDWVYANGFTMDDKRSGGIPGGASQVYQRIAALLARDQDEQIDDLERIDKALRERSPFFFYGSDIDLDPYLEKSQPLIAGVVKEMQNNVGQLTNVRSIIISGGGAALYASAIRKAFPRVTLEVIDAPCLANAKGFLVVGEAGLARERATAKA
ncbi:hypothetical protein [Paraburkholderia sp. GAS334]|uniref:hypothetical protein n=1 Tax=Paraburkholderia sp. GAS334 TaxID=3035131 RepID=UPI003D20C5E0